MATIDLKKISIIYYCCNDSISEDEDLSSLGISIEKKCTLGLALVIQDQNKSCSNFILVLRMSQGVSLKLTDFFIFVVFHY